MGPIKKCTDKNDAPCMERGRSTRLWALLPADTRGYHQWHRGYQRIPVTQGRQSWRTTRQGRRTPLDTSGRRIPRETPVRWGLPEGMQTALVWLSNFKRIRLNCTEVEMFLKKVSLIDCQWEMDTDFKGITVVVLYVSGDYVWFCC